MKSEYFLKKLPAIISDLRQRGVQNQFINPPIIRILWALQFPVRPIILINSLWLMASVYGFVFLMALFFLSLFIGLQIAILASLSGSLLCSCYYMIIIIIQRKRFNIPSWDEYLREIEAKSKNL